MTTIVNTKVGLNRGKKRIFLEGQKLSREGYAPGMLFNLTVKDDQLQIVLSETGKYKISRRKNRTTGDELPVIDITAQEMAELFAEDEQVRVLIQQGRIVVSTHHLTDNRLRREERLLDKLTNRKTLRTASVFHGGGVLDLAVHQGLALCGVKSKIAVAIERDGRYLDSSLRNNPELWDKDSIVMESAVEMVNLQRSKRTAECDLLIAGIPCTGASLAGRSKNKIKQAEDHDEAGACFFYTLELISQLNPGCVILENVPMYQSSASMSVIRSVLNSLGYVVQERILNGVEFDALENRDRLCVVALSSGITGFDLDAICGSIFPEKPETISEILEDIPLDSPRWKSFDYLAEKEQRDIAAGKGFRRQLLTGEESCLGTIGRGYAKMRGTEPFIIHPTDSSLSRILTAKEHARVKNIPESLIDGVSETLAHEILGQSVVFSAFTKVTEALSISLVNWMRNWTEQANMNIEPIKKCA